MAYVYRVFCNTEQAWKQVEMATSTPPSACPSGADHSLEPESITLVEAKEALQVEPLPFANPSGFRARYKGKLFTAQAGAVTNLDYQLTEERWINGIRIKCKGQAFGDRIHLHVVHPTYGVLDPFGEDWYLSGDRQDQVEEQLSYPARLPAGLIVRIVYHSTGSEDVQIALNMRLHKKST